MRVKYANKVFQVLYTKEVAGLTLYAVEDEPNHVDWLVNVEVVDAEKKEPKKIEQKHTEWSEEDEKMFRSLSNALARISSNTRTDSTSINYSFFAEIDWLKSLKDRVQPQHKEWSEEDENYLQSAENACEYQYGKNTSTILWLKSLKDRVRGKED